jgi:serine/threonine protein kinase
MDGTVKIADFGRAQRASATGLCKLSRCACVFGCAFALNSSLFSVVLPNESVMPVRWVPLEVLQQGVYSHASDVWAYGVVLWEIFSCGKTPFGALFMYVCCHE